jgi:hypothetical protein
MRCPTEMPVDVFTNRIWIDARAYQELVDLAQPEPRIWNKQNYKILKNYIHHTLMRVIEQEQVRTAAFQIYFIYFFPLHTALESSE